MDKNITVFTVGHSTRSLDEFLQLLKHYSINELIDIRTIPKSRHNPQFNEHEFAHFLRSHHIGYRHQKNLGGLRHPHKDSVNTAWKNSSFRGFADYMQTEEFQKGLETLIKIAHEKNVVVMCAEALPWRCHRSLIGDALVLHEIDVEDIFSMTLCKPHKLTPWAVVHKKTITYPAPLTK